MELVLTIPAALGAARRFPRKCRACIFVGYHGEHDLFVCGDPERGASVKVVGASDSRSAGRLCDADPLKPGRSELNAAAACLLLLT